MTEVEQVEEAVFKQAYIPKTLGELPEKKILKDSASGLNNTYYATVTGLNPTPPHPTPHTPYPTPNTPHPTPHTRNAQAHCPKDRAQGVPLSGILNPLLNPLS
jgi:hypothetical protein